MHPPCQGAGKTLFRGAKKGLTPGTLLTDEEFDGFRLLPTPDQLASRWRLALFRPAQSPHPVQMHANTHVKIYVSGVPGRPVGGTLRLPAAS